ncbi:remorin, partial [Phtheirospermum japonicum]
TWSIGAPGDKEGRIYRETEKQNRSCPRSSRRKTSDHRSQTQQRSSQSRGNSSKILRHWDCSEEITRLFLIAENKVAFFFFFLYIISDLDFYLLFQMYDFVYLFIHC